MKLPAIDVIKSFLTNPMKIPANIFWRIPRTISDKRHIFVVGAPRSGTTLLQSIISVHPNVKSLDEETGFFMLRDIFKLRLDGVDSEMVAQAQQASDDIVDYYDAVAFIVTKNDPAVRFLEKTPQHVLRLGFITKFFPNAQVIHIVRDGRDCYCSAKGHKGVVQGKDVKSYAKYWEKCIRSRLLCDSSQIFDVKYEDLTSDPETVMRQVMHFLGETFIMDQIDPAKYSRNKMSTKKEFTKLNSKISIASQNRWKEEMSSDEKDIFLLIARQCLSSFGYEYE